jgi:hypothetical protein
MPLDTSIPAQVQVPQFNGLAALGTVQQFQQRKLQQQQLKQQLAANQAASEAVKQSIDPATGELDQAKFANLLSQGAGAYNLPEYMKKSVDLQNAQTQGKTQKFDLAQKQFGYWNGQLGALMSNPKATKDDVINSLANALQAGMITPQQAQQEAANIPQDQAALPAYLKNHWMSLQSAKDQVALLPQGGTVNTGGVTQFTNRDPITGQWSLAGGLQNTLSPGEASANVQGVTPGGTPYQITKAQQLAGQVPGQAPAQGQGYTGRYNAPQTGDLPQGAMQTGLAPGQQAALTAQGSTSNQAAQVLHDASADAPMRINLLENARSSLENIDTGPGSDWRNTAKSFVNSLSPGVAQKLGIAGDVQDYDEFKKILTNYASSISGSIGSGTDARLNAAVTGNANPGISKLANQDILTKTIAAEKMRAAQDYAFQQSGQTTDKFNQWQSQWNKNVNPDAFVFTSMTPEQQQSFIDRKTKDGSLPAFKKDLATLVRSGVLTPPGQQ